MGRMELQNLLEDTLGSTNVYFQPPETIRIQYPCIIYKLSNIRTKFADNLPYDFMKRYQLTVIDKNPDSVIPEKVALLPMCAFDRHFTAANLNNKFHRSIEAETTSQVLLAIFKNERHFVHHEALPQVALFGDEGAANHNRLGGDYAKRGVQVFVYGQQHLNNGLPGPKRYPARQTREASEAIARLHRLDEAHTVFVQQNPDVIDQGVFHNDVIAVSNQQVLFHHQHAFLNQDQAFAEIRQKMASIGEDFISIEVPENRVTVDDAVATYLFNSQILTRPDGGMTIVVPEESRQNAAVWSYLNDMIQMGTPIDAIQVYDLRESMRNGGGPACLRLRVALNETELNAVNPKVLMNDQLFTTLNQWVDKHYRDRLAQEDLADPHLLMESRMALDELTKILGLGSVYPFQK